MKRKREDREVRRKIFKVGYGAGQWNARILGEGTAKREAEKECREAGVEV